MVAQIRISVLLLILIVGQLITITNAYQSGVVPSDACWTGPGHPPSETLGQPPPYEILVMDDDGAPVTEYLPGQILFGK